MWFIPYNDTQNLYEFIQIFVDIVGVIVTHLKNLILSEAPLCAGPFFGLASIYKDALSESIMFNDQILLKFDFVFAQNVYTIFLLHNITNKKNYSFAGENKTSSTNI